jgi:hypothetical protein
MHITEEINNEQRCCKSAFLRCGGVAKCHRRSLSQCVIILRTFKELNGAFIS